MADIYTYPQTSNNIYAYQGTDVEYTTRIFSDSAGVTPLDITGYTFTARFYRTLGTTALATVSVTNNTAIVTGQLVVKLGDGDLGEHSMDTVGAWDLIGAEPDGDVKLFDWGQFFVKNDPAT